jgi:hypothetical protein
MVSYVTNLVELIGLGLAIDYSLLIVHRFREEVARGAETEEAIVRTMATAGRAVVFSGDGGRDRARLARVDAAAADPVARGRRDADPARLDRRRADAASRRCCRCSDSAACGPCGSTAC